jgi:ribosomal protein S18 acetylase RimI-like enzyme
VVASLPYHFGDAGGRAACARAVRAGPGLVACADNGVIAFLTWRPWYGVAAETTWMAVHAGWRRRGIGRDLLRALTTDVPRATRYLVVTTLAEATPEPAREDTYAGTRRFYRDNGFEPIWEPEGWWNEGSQAVLMVRLLDRNE